MSYLYDVDHHQHARVDLQDLVQQLRGRCPDEVLGLEFAATNTATDLIDAGHPHQDVYPVLAELVKQLPKGSAKTPCASRLPDVEKRLKKTE